jgi:hypothetical protein
MPQTADRGSAPPRPPATWCIRLPMGWWLALPDPGANRRGAIVWWRGLRRRDGWPVVTDAPIAPAWGDADRRHGHPCWAECAAGGAALVACLQRRQNVDAEVGARCAQIWQAQP